MCLAVPLKLIEINGKTATGEAMGMTRQHAGFAIERVPEGQALADLAAWEEMEAALE